MKHPHYELVAVSGDDLLPHIDAGRGIEDGKPADARQLARQLARFRTEQPMYHPDVPASARVDLLDGKSQPAGAVAVDILLSQVGADRVVDLLHASPRVRAAMEAHLEAELAPPGLGPSSPLPASGPGAPGRSRGTRPAPSRS